MIEFASAPTRREDFLSRTERRFRKMVRLLLPVALLLMVAVPATSLADLDGDGLEEIGAFAVEVEGSARGNWYQAWNADGTIVMSRPGVLPGFSSLQQHTMDVEGDGTDELAILGVRDSNGSVKVEVRRTLGAVMASGFVLGTGFSQVRMFPIDSNGDSRDEIGLVYVEDSTGRVFFKTFVTGGGNILQFKVGLTAVDGFLPLDAFAVDSFGTGSQMLFVAFERVADGATLYRIFDVRDGSLVANQIVGGANLGGFQFVPGDFAPASAGEEILVGFLRTAGGSSAYRVYHRSGTITSSAGVRGSGWTGHTFGKLDDGAGRDQVFVGYSSTAGHHFFDVFDPSGARTTRQMVLGAGADVSLAQWVTGNFAGAAGSAEEVQGVFVKNSNGNIGATHWTQSGLSIATSLLFPGDKFINPQGLAVEALSAGSDTLFIGVQKIGEMPLISLWNSSYVNILRRPIFNSDVI